MRPIIKRSFGRRVFEAVNVTILVIVSFVMLYPFYFCLIASVSKNAAVLAAQVNLLPIGFNLNSYKMVLGYDVVWRSYANTVYYTVLGTAINLFLTTLGAYPLSRSGFYGKRVFMIFIAITMFFSGGLIPTFLLIKGLGMYNTVWALVLPGAISTTNMIIMRTFFQGIPRSIEEAAIIDGASDSYVLTHIILPLSLSSIMSIGLFYAVGHWNSWFSAMIYLLDSKRYPLQLVLRQIVLQNQINDIVGTTVSRAEDTANMISENVKYTVIIVATIPILCVYPFIQKYFAKGVMIGSIKG